MPQISLYIDKVTLKKIEHAASIEHKSISNWVGSKITKLLGDKWPEDYFSLYGSVKDDTFRIRKNMTYSNDSKRESL